jgi:hypothetical protein
MPNAIRTVRSEARASLVRRLDGGRVREDTERTRSVESSWPSLALALSVLQAQGSMRTWTKQREAYHWSCRNMQKQNRSRKLAEDKSPLTQRRETRSQRNWVLVEGWIVSALSVGSEWNECHEANYLLSHHHLHRPNDDMKFSKFLRLPKSHRWSRSKTRSEIAPTDDGQSEADQTIPRLTESTPDLRIGTSTLPTPSPLASRDQESDSMYTTLSRKAHLSPPFRVTQTLTPFPIKFLSVPGTDQSSLPKSSGYTADPETAPESKSDWGSTAYATTKLAINLVKESSDVFPPLKSILGGLSAILDHCDVRSISSKPTVHGSYDGPSKRSPVAKR